jgi:hypothetical protein
MRRHIMMLGGVLLSGLVMPLDAMAGLKAVTAYEPWKLGRPGGYSEKIKSPMRWVVKGTSTSSATGGFALAMTLHRAAIRARATGYTHFYAVKLDITNSQYCAGCSFGNQVVYLTAVPTNDPNAQFACEAKGRMVENCGIHDVSEALSKHGSILGRTAAMQDDEVKMLKDSLNVK